MENTLVPPARLYWREGLAEIRKSWRLPQFILPTILLPVSFYGLFAIAMGRGRPAEAAYALATFGVFAAIGPSLFGFGVGISDERQANLIELKRVSPLPAGAYMVGKIAASVLFTAVAVLLIYSLGILGGNVSLPLERWPMLFAVHLLSVAPFALIGLGIGMRLTAKGAIAAANFLFLGFSVLGGLWFPIEALPAWMQSLAWVMPSWHLGELALMAAGFPRPHSALLHGAILMVVTAGACAFALTGWQRSAA